MVGCRRNGPIAMPSAGPSPLGDRLGHRLALKKIRPPLLRFESQRLVSVGYAWLAGQMGALLAEKRFANADEKGALRMIFDLLKNAGTYQNLPAIYRALQYLQTLDPAALPESRVEIDGFLRTPSGSPPSRLKAVSLRRTGGILTFTILSAGWRGSVSRRSVHLRRSSRSARKRTSGSTRGSTIR